MSFGGICLFAKNKFISIEQLLDINSEPVPYNACSLHVGSLLVRSGRNSQDAAERDPTERSTVRSLHVCYQLSNVAV